MVYIIHFKKSRFVEDLLFYIENEVIAFPKIEIYETELAMFNVYIKSDVVI